MLDKIPAKDIGSAGLTHALDWTAGATWTALEHRSNVGSSNKQDKGIPRCVVILAASNVNFLNQTGLRSDFQKCLNTVFWGQEWSGEGKK